MADEEVQKSIFGVNPESLKDAKTTTAKLQIINSILSQGEMKMLDEQIPEFREMLGAIKVKIAVAAAKADLKKWLGDNGFTINTTTDKVNSAGKTSDEASKGYIEKMANSEAFKNILDGLADMKQATVGDDLKDAFDLGKLAFKQAGSPGLEGTVKTVEDAQTLFIKIWDEVWPIVADKIKGYEDSNKAKLTVVGEEGSKVKVGNKSYSAGETIVFTPKEVIKLLQDSKSFKDWSAERMGRVPDDDIVLDSPVGEA